MDLGVFFGAALLKRRLSAGPTAEKEKTQKIIMLFASAGFIALLVLPALDYRFMWSNVPLYAIMAGDILAALCFYITFLVYKENTFSSATIEIAKDQKVISTGPYAIVRHPMYAGGSLLFITTPLALGSYWGLLAFVAALPALVWAAFRRRRVSCKELAGIYRLLHKSPLAINTRNLLTSRGAQSDFKTIFSFSSLGRQILDRSPFNELNISCQDGKSLRRVENDRYDFQIITFQDLKKAPVIAAIEPS